MSNSWIMFVKAYSAKNKMKYNEALKDSGLKSAYQKSKKGNDQKSSKEPKKTKKKGKKNDVEE